MPSNEWLQSGLCTEASARELCVDAWAAPLRRAWAGGTVQGPILHRKFWEWAFIVRALGERGMLRPGARGLGFGVGQEPHAALFASMGCDIVATDLPAGSSAAAAWTATAQHAASEERLNAAGLCEPSL